MSAPTRCSSCYQTAVSLLATVVIALAASVDAGEKDAATQSGQSPAVAAEKGSATKGVSGEARRTLAPEAALKTRIKHLDVKNATVVEVIGILQQSVRFECFVDGRVGSTKVTIKADDATIESILNRMATQGGFRWTIRWSSIYISTTADIPARYAGKVMAREPAPKQPVPPKVGIVDGKLEKTIAVFAVSDQPVSEVLKKLSNETGVRITLDPKAMGRLSRITIELKDTTAKAILDLVADQASLKWTIVGDHVNVVRKPLKEKLNTRIAEFIVTKEYADAALSKLSKMSNIEIVFDNKSTQEDLRRRQTVILELKGATPWTVLDLITTAVGLKWAVVGERIVVSEGPL